MPTEDPISGRFAQFRRAEAAIIRLLSHPALGIRSLELVEPVNADYDHQAVGRATPTLLRRHLLLVAFGLVGGVGVWAGLLYSGLGFLGLSAGYALIMATYFGAFVGLLLCAAYSRHARRASRSWIRPADHGWTVVVYCREGRQTGLARRILAEESES